MPFFEVKVLVQVVIHAEADTQDDANMLAFQHVDPAKGEHTELQSSRALITKEEIDRSRRHCDQVITAQ